MFEYRAHEYSDDLGKNAGPWSYFQVPEHFNYVANMLTELGRDGWRLVEWDRERYFVLLEREVKDGWQQPRQN